MAITTSKPSRRLGRMPEAPSYEGLAAKYADDFRRATLQQEENDLNLLLSQWQRGEVDFDVVKKYLNEKISANSDNAAKKSNYMDTLSKVEAQNQKQFEADQKSKVDLKRSELTEKYMVGGISSQEQLAIVDALKKEADPKSEAYRSLISEEADLRTQLSKSGVSSGNKVKAAEIAQKMSEINTAMRISEYNYKNGLASGAEYEQAITNNSQEALDLVKAAVDSGIDVSRADYSIYDPVLGREADIGAVNQTSKQRQEWRTNGMMVDVVNKSGDLVPVTINQLQEDIIRNPSNPEFQREPYNVVQDPDTLQYKLVDPVTGEAAKKVDAKGNPVLDKKGVPIDYSATTAESAKSELRSLAQSSGYQLAVRTDNGFENWNYDPNTASFSPKENPGVKYMSIPSTTEQRNLFQYQKPAGMQEQDYSNYVTEGQNKFLQSGGMSTALPLSSSNVGIDFVADKMPPSPEKLQEASDKLKPYTEPLITSAKSKIGPLLEPLTKAYNPAEISKRIGEMGKQITSSLTPNMSSVSSPSFTLPKFTMPDFTNFTSGASASLSSPTNFSVMSPASVGPKMSPQSSSPSFGERVKSFGQQAVGTIKRLIGGQ